MKSRVKSGEHPPKISVITVCRNAASTIEETLRSVREQDYPHIEHIVIDGASTDGTVEFIRQHADGIAYWVSEPDHGIADAMNKGIAKATGDYLLFINADDRLLAPHALTSAVETIDQHPGMLIYAFGVLFDYGDTTVERQGRGFTPWMNLKTGILHQGAICSRQLFETIGGMDARYKIALDYDFFLRAYRAGATIHQSGKSIAGMRMDGISSQRDLASLYRRFREEFAIQARNAGNPFRFALYLLYWPSYALYALIRHGLPRRQ